VQIYDKFKAGGVKINKKIYGGIKDELDKILIGISQMSDLDPDTIIAKIEEKFNNIKRQYDNEKQDTIDQMQEMNELNEQLIQEFEQLDSKTKYQMSQLLLDKGTTEEKLSRLIDLLDSELYIEKSKQKLYPTIFTDEWFQDKKKLLIDMRKGLKSTTSLLLENEKKMHELKDLNNGLIGLLNEFKDGEQEIHDHYNKEIKTLNENIYHYQTQIQDVFNKHRSDTQALENVHQLEIEHYQNQIRDLFDKHQIKIDELTEEQRSLAIQLMQCGSEKDRLNKYYAQQLQLQEKALTDGHNTQMGKLTAIYSQRVTEYELRLKGYFEQLAQLKTNHEAKIEELTHEFEKEMSHVINSHGEEIQILEYSHKQEIDALNKHYEDEIEALNKHYEDKIEDMQSNIDILRNQILTMANKHKNELDSRERDYQSNLATLKIEYDADLQIQQRAFDDNTRKLEQKMLDALNVNKNTIDGAIEEFEKKHTSLSELLDKFKEAYDKVYQQIKDTLRERYNKLEQKIQQLNLAQIAYTRQFEEYLAKNEGRVKDLATLVKKISRMVNN
jgi:phage host-nuclease inhibitor protein Gam